MSSQTLQSYKYISYLSKWFSHCLSYFPAVCASFPRSELFSHGLSYLPTVWAFFPQFELFSIVWVLVCSHDMSYFPGSGFFSNGLTNFKQFELLFHGPGNFPTVRAIPNGIQSTFTWSALHYFPRLKLFSNCLSYALSCFSRFELFSHGAMSYPIYFPTVWAICSKLWEIFPRPDLLSTIWKNFPSVWTELFSHGLSY